MIIISMNISCWDRSISCCERYRRSISSIIKSDWTLLVGPSGSLNKKIFGHFNVSTSRYFAPSILWFNFAFCSGFYLEFFALKYCNRDWIWLTLSKLLIFQFWFSARNARFRDSWEGESWRGLMMHPWAKSVSEGPLASHQISVCQNYFNFHGRNSRERPFVKPISASQWPQSWGGSWHFTLSLVLWQECCKDEVITRTFWEAWIMSRAQNCPIMTRCANVWLLKRKSKLYTQKVKKTDFASFWHSILIPLTLDY